MDTMEVQVQITGIVGGKTGIHKGIRKASAKSFRNWR